jgi:hypothetical protein
MWNVLKPTDIDEAQRQLGARRAELLRRHAEEMAHLEADQVDLEALDRLAAMFATKFKKTLPPVPTFATGKKVDAPATRPQPVTHRPQPRASHSDKRNLSGTNFEVFSRAVSKAGF